MQVEQEKTVVIGLEIENTFGKICYYTDDMEEPATYVTEGDNPTCYIDAIAYKYKGNNNWCFGREGYKAYMLGECLKVDDFIEMAFNYGAVTVEETEYDARAIMQAYISHMLGCIEEDIADKKIGVIAVCTQNYEYDYINFLKEMIEAVAGEVSIEFFSKDDCFGYYVSASKDELKKNDVAIFELYNSEIICRYVTKGKYQKQPVCVVINSSSEIEATEKEKIDAYIAEYARKKLDRKIMSSVYITGSEFEKSRDYEKFYKTVCNRRRVFVGQNIYIKGACYAAVKECLGSKKNEVYMLCDDRIMSDVDIEIIVNEQPKILRTIYAGSRWIDIDKSYEFIRAGAGNLNILSTSIENGVKERNIIGIGRYSDRPDKTTRIHVDIRAKNSKQLEIKVKDMGFGNMHKVTGEVINRQIMLG